MVIEKLKMEDIPQLLELYKELGDFGSSIKISEEIYEKMLEDDNYLLLVAKKDGKVVGSSIAISCMILALNGQGFIVIEDVIVSSECRKMGIARSIMNEIDNFAKSKNCAYSILVSSDYREEAHKFYESVGFVDGVKGFRKWY